MTDKTVFVKGFALLECEQSAVVELLAWALHAWPYPMPVGMCSGLSKVDKAVCAARGTPASEDKPDPCKSCAHTARGDFGSPDFPCKWCRVDERGRASLWQGKPTQDNARSDKSGGAA